MARGVDQVQGINFIVGMLMVQLNSVTFNSNTTFSLQIHAIQCLVLHFPFRNGFGGLQQPVGKRTLTVVNMCYDAKIADIFHAE